MIGEGYAAIPTWMLRDETISAPALLVYASLASRAGFQSIHPSQKLIAGEARCSERRVRDAIAELEERGLVERVQRRYATGQRAPDGYVLHSSVKPSALAEQPAAVAGSESQPAVNDRANRQIPESSPYIEITKEEIDIGSKRVRADVDSLLDLLDEEIRRSDARDVPKRNKGNHDAMRLLLDRDGYSAEEVAAVIKWAHADQFWYTNILSAAKLRKQFATLRGQMQRGAGRNAAQSPASRVLGVDLGGMSGGYAKGPQIAAGGVPSIMREIEGGRW